MAAWRSKLPIAVKVTYFIDTDEYRIAIGWIPT